MGVKRTQFLRRRTLVTVWARNVREREGQRLGEGVALVDWAGRQTVLALTV